MNRTTAGVGSGVSCALLSLGYFLSVASVSVVERRAYRALSVQKCHGIDLDKAARRELLHFHRQSGGHGGRAQIASEEIAVRAREA